MYDLNALGWLFAGLCGLVVGMSKCGLPGLGSLAVPMMAGVLPAKTATGALLPLLVAGDMAGALHFRRHADWLLLLRLLPIAVCGIWLGYVLLGQPWVDDHVIRMVTATIVLALVVMNQFRGRLHAWASGDGRSGVSRWAVAVLFGLLAGVTTMLANAAGPVMLIYLLAMRLQKDEFIGTFAWFFVVINWLKVPFMVCRGMITADSLLFNLRLLPALLLGCWLGIVLSRRLSNDRFRLWIELLTALAALLLFLPPGLLSSLARQLLQP